MLPPSTEEPEISTQLAIFADGRGKQVALTRISLPSTIAELPERSKLSLADQPDQRSYLTVKLL